MASRRRKEVETKKRRKRTVMLTCGILIIIYLFLLVIFGENNFLRYVKLKSIKTDLQVETRGIKRQNEETKKQIDIIKKDPVYLEELARKHGLTRDDEIVFEFGDER
jgi:cell division protein FtsB